MSSPQPTLTRETIELASGEVITRQLDLDPAVTLTRPATGHAILVQVLSDDAYYTLNGSTTPTATNSFKLFKDQNPIRLPVPGSAIIFFGSGTSDLRYQWAE